MEEQVQSMEVLLSETEVWLHVNNTLVLLHINMNIVHVDEPLELSCICLLLHG